jgi:hypothetical protein
VIWFVYAVELSKRAMEKEEVKGELAGILCAVD